MRRPRFLDHTVYRRFCEINDVPPCILAKYFVVFTLLSFRNVRNAVIYCMRTVRYLADASGVELHTLQMRQCAVAVSAVEHRVTFLRVVYPALCLRYRVSLLRRPKYRACSSTGHCRRIGRIMTGYTSYRPGNSRHNLAYNY